MVKEYKAELMHPYYAAERGLVDDVIDPAETRAVLITSLAMLRDQARRPAVAQARQPAAVTPQPDDPQDASHSPARTEHREHPAPAPTLVRVEKGHAEPEELAAITAILLARAAARPRPVPRPPRSAPGRLAPPGAHSPASAPRTAGAELTRLRAPRERGALGR